MIKYVCKKGLTSIDSEMALRTGVQNSLMPGHREVAPAQGCFRDGILHGQMVHVAPVSSYMMVVTISGTWRDPSPVDHECRNPICAIINGATQDHTGFHQTGSPKDFPDVRFRGWEVLKGIQI